MQLIIHRVWHRVLCGEDIASGARTDRRYRTGSCRTLAYRARLLANTKEPQSITRKLGL